MHIYFRHRSHLLLIVAAVLAGCESSPGEGPVEDLLPFEAVFEPAEVVELRPAANDPLGRPVKVLEWGEELAIIDAMQGNVKVFTRDGSLARTLGRIGDGPGEFREPIDAVVLENGDLLVLDRPHVNLVRFDASGTHLGDIAIDGIRPGGLELVKDAFGQERLAVAYDGRDEELGVRNNGIHLLGTDGEFLHTVVLLPPPAEPNKRPFATPVTSTLDRGVAVGTLYTDTVRIYDVLTGEGRSLPLGGAGYRPPAWPTTPVDSRGLADWALDQMWLMQVFGADQIIVASLFTHDRSERMDYYQYVVSDPWGEVHASTAPSPRQIIAFQGETAYTIDMSLDGGAFLQTYRLRLGPVSDRAAP